MVVESIRHFFERHGIGPARVVAACSGGIDSTALLLALADMRAAGYEVVCGHLNHHLRGDESDGDERFVRELCARLEVPLDVCDGSIDPEAIRRSGLEAAAREVRHARLQEIRGASGFVATAHQKNDQAETIVMRLITGSGLAGLRAIHEARADGVIRPLIEVTRDDIVAFLAERGVTPRNDRMNDDPRFLRNRVRAALRNFDPEAIGNIAAVATQAQQLWPHVERVIDAAEREHADVADHETRFTSWPADPWMRQALLQRHIRRLGSSREVSSTDLERLAAGVPSIDRVSVTKELELIRRNGALVLRRLPEPTDDFELPIRAGEAIFIPQIGATVSIRQPTTDNRQLIQLPHHADPSFVVRNRRNGDRFRPLGMSADKKLKDFLIDRKIPAELRDRIPLLVWNGEIVWVAGIEVSDRFKVTCPAEALFEVVLKT
ncbi:MAG TPA: tRNA lysidine(34) synthetase TilS [Thermoanaerobaculia bacterium]